MIIVVLLLSLFPAISTSASSPSSHNFLLCLTSAAVSFSGHIHTPADPNYSTFLQSAIRDPKFNTTQTPKPSLILTPDSLSQIQAAVSCSRKHGLHIRVRSGGHDYEGLSYTSNNSSSKFAVLDLVNFRNIAVDLAGKTAWVDSGAILGELYYRIAEKSRKLAFPAGTCHTVGVGGHFSGGGFGLLVRKFGLAADNVVDAILVDSNGRVVDRKSMGEDLFWAIRGGGGNSFGIVVSWKVKLFSVPEKLTSFSVQRTLPPNDGKLVHRWQTVANELPRDLIIEVVVSNRNISTSTSRIGTSTIAIFNALFLGKTEELLKLMQRSFPELGIRKQDCREMSWSRSGQVFNRNCYVTTKVLLRTYYRGKSDYVQVPTPEAALLKIWKKFDDIDVGSSAMVMVPFGGKMNEIDATSIPFPHRIGKLELYDYVEPYVSKDPRSAYVNYRDLDIGVNGGDESGGTSYGQAKVWGEKYFGVNFNRLVRVKTVVDPSNVFRNEQSIPPILT
ncbi:Tetrahydroberberine oxidase [Linum perenne]